MSLSYDLNFYSYSCSIHPSLLLNKYTPSTFFHLYSLSYPSSAISQPATLFPYTHWPSHYSLHYTDPAILKSYFYHISPQPSQTSCKVHPIVPFFIAKYFFITKHYNLNTTYNQYVYFLITNLQEYFRYAENQTRHGYRP